MENGILVREATTADMEQVRAIFREFVAYHALCDPSFVKVENHDGLFAAYAVESARDGRGMLLVALRGGEVAGYCLGLVQEKPPVYPDPSYGLIDNLAVMERHQHQGVGAALCVEMRRWFHARGVKRIEVCAAVRNPKSTRFWRKMGFEPYIEQMFDTTAGARTGP